MATRSRRLFRRPGGSTERTLRSLVRGERAGGALILAATIAALVAANSPLSDSYETLRNVVPFDVTLSLPAGLSIHLGLTLGQWVMDGVLALFFFVVGLELKREIVAGELRRPATAVVPIAAAVGGMVVPAAIYLALNAGNPAGSAHGWAVPIATDIAFALAVLAVVGRRLPSSLRAFLLTLAIVDDLLAILVIAAFYSSGQKYIWLIPAALCLGVVAYLTRRRVTNLALLLPLAAATWLFVHESGIHATIAGVALGLVVPATKRRREKVSPAEHWEHRCNPVSTLFAVPVFAFFAAGVAVGSEALSSVLREPVGRGIVLGLVVGKPLGILAASFLVASLTRATLPRGMSWWDVLGIATIGGIGFTVSLLIGDLAFGAGTVFADHAKAAVLVGSALAALGGASILAWRNRAYGRATGSLPQREARASRPPPTGSGRGGRTRHTRVSAPGSGGVHGRSGDGRTPSTPPPEGGD